MVDVIGPKNFRDCRTLVSQDFWDGVKLTCSSTITKFIVEQVVSEKREIESVVVDHDTVEPCDVDRATHR